MKGKWHHWTNWLFPVVVSIGSIVSDVLHDGAGAYCAVMGIVSCGVGMIIGARVVSDFWHEWAEQLDLEEPLDDD